MEGFIFIKKQLSMTKDASLFHCANHYKGVCAVSQWGTMTSSCVLRISTRLIQILYYIYCTEYISIDRRYICWVSSIRYNSCLLQLLIFLVFTICPWSNKPVLTQVNAETGEWARNMSSQTSFKQTPMLARFIRKIKQRQMEKLFAII